MLRNILILGIVIIVTAAATIALDYQSRQRVAPANIQTIPASPLVMDKPAPQFAFTDMKDRQSSLNALSDKIIVLNFWASWCPPCIKELPVLFQIAQENPDDVILLAVSSDQTEDAMETFLNNLPEEHQPALARENVYFTFDEGKRITGGLFNVFRLPQTIVIDGQGVMRHRHLGGIFDPDELNKVLTDLRG